MRKTETAQLEIGGACEPPSPFGQKRLPAPGSPWLHRAETPAAPVPEQKNPMMQCTKQWIPPPAAQHSASQPARLTLQQPENRGFLADTN
ncbi:MAG: hypothetical protein OXF20_10145 [Gammaproteobacteria bacterium]|nr:hypothetical protein [Gammaproteobacteria bacterium]